MTLPYPPPWQDRMTLAAHLSISPESLENWVRDGVIPPPRKRGGKLMWNWPEVDAWMRQGTQNGVPQTATEIRDAVRRKLDATPRHARH